MKFSPIYNAIGEVTLIISLHFFLQSLDTFIYHNLEILCKAVKMADFSLLNKIGPKSASIEIFQEQWPF